MVYLVGPGWFYGLDSGFELVATLITLFIAIYGVRIYLLTRQRRHAYFTLAFIFIALSYLIRAVTDWLAFTHFLGRIPNVTAAVNNLVAIPTLYVSGFLVHLFLMLAGFMILVAIYMGIRDVKTVSLLFIFVLILTALSQSKFIAFHLTLFVMLLFICIHLYRNYSRTKTVNSFLVLYSMASLLAANVFFVLVLLSPFYYVVGHVLQLIGFMLLLLNLILVLK